MVVPSISIPDFVRRNTGQYSDKKTVLWDFANGEMVTTPDGKVLVYSGPLTPKLTHELLKNRIRKVLATIQGESVLYPLSYGSNFDHLIGKSPDYVEARIASMVSESLSSIRQIDRIEIRSLTFNSGYADFDLVIYDKNQSEVTIQDVRISGVLG